MDVGPYTLVTGEVFAADFAGLSAIAHPLDTTDLGDVVGWYAWTNSLVDGTRETGDEYEHCLSWTSSALTNVFGESGRTFSAGRSWTESRHWGCANLLHLYCFEQ